VRSVVDRNVVMRRMTVAAHTASTFGFTAMLPRCLLYIFQCCHYHALLCTAWLPPTVAHRTTIFCFSCGATAIHLRALPRVVKSMTLLLDVCEVRTAQGMWHTSCVTITLCCLWNKTHSCKDTVCVAACRPVDWFAWMYIGMVTYIMAALRKLVVQYLASLRM
jgi:hypothetical protein